MFINSRLLGLEKMTNPASVYDFLPSGVEPVRDVSKDGFAPRRGERKRELRVLTCTCGSKSYFAFYKRYYVEEIRCLFCSHEYLFRRATGDFLRKISAVAGRETEAKFEAQAE